MNKDYNDFVERMTSFDLDLTAQEPGDINMRVSDSKPSLDTALAHYGVKGMKWGQRKAESSSSSGKRPSRRQARKQRNADIRRARVATAVRQGKLEEGIIDLEFGDTKRVRANGARMIAKYSDQLANSPDTQTAQKLTTGEKWTLGLGGAAMALSFASVIVDANR